MQCTSCLYIPTVLVTGRADPWGPWAVPAHEPMDWVGPWTHGLGRPMGLGWAVPWSWAEPELYEVARDRTRSSVSNHATIACNS